MTTPSFPSVLPELRFQGITCLLLCTSQVQRPWLNTLSMGQHFEHGSNVVTDAWQML